MSAIGHDPQRSSEHRLDRMSCPLSLRGPYFKIPDRDDIPDVQITASYRLGIDDRSVEAVQVFDAKPVIGPKDQRVVATDKFTVKTQLAVLTSSDHDARLTFFERHDLCDFSILENLE
jgi:hypothetical protein